MATTGKVKIPLVTSPERKGTEEKGTAIQSTPGAGQFSLETAKNSIKPTPREEQEQRSIANPIERLLPPRKPSPLPIFRQPGGGYAPYTPSPNVSLPTGPGYVAPPEQFGAPVPIETPAPKLPPYQAPIYVSPPSIPRYGTEERGTTIRGGKPYDVEFFTQPTLFRPRQKDFVDPETGEVIPVYGTVQVAEPAGKSLGGGAYQLTTRPATPEEVTQFEAFEKEQRGKEPGRIVSGTLPLPGTKVNLPKLFRTEEELRTTLTQDVEDLNPVQALAEFNRGGNLLLREIGIDENVLTGLSKFAAKTSPLTTILPFTEPYTEATVRKGLEAGFKHPVTSAITFGFGAGFGAVFEGALILAETVGGPTVAAATKTILRYGGDVLAGIYAVDIGKQLIRTDITTEQKADIFGGAVVETGLFIGGAVVGGKAVKYAFDPQFYRIPFTEIELTPKERSIAAKTTPALPDRLVFQSSKEADVLIKKFDQEGIKYQVKEGSQVVVIPRAKLIASDFLGTTPKPTYIGKPTGGSIFLTDIYGNLKEITATRAQAQKQYTDLLARLKRGEVIDYRTGLEINKGELSDYQARQLLRFQTPQKIRSSIEVEAVVRQGVTPDIVNIDGTQINTPIKQSVTGKVNTGFGTFYSEVKTGGRKATFELSAEFEKEPLLEKDGKISQLAQDAEQKIIYRGKKTVTGKTLKGELDFAEVYKITPRAIQRAELPFEGSSLFEQQESVSQVSFSQRIKNIGDKDLQVFKRTSETFGSTGRNIILTRGPSPEVVFLKELPPSLKFDIKSNTYPTDVFITGEGATNAELKLYKLSGEKITTAQQLPFLPEFAESYKLVGQERVGFKETAVKVREPVKIALKTPRRIYYSDPETGKIKVRFRGEPTPKAVSEKFQDLSYLNAPPREPRPKPSGFGRATSLSFEDEKLLQSLQQNKQIYIPTVEPLSLSFSITKTAPVSENLFGTVSRVDSFSRSLDILSAKNIVQVDTSTKVLTRAATRLEPKIESKVETRVETRVEPRLDIRTSTRLEPKLEPRVSTRLEPKLEVKLEPKLTLEPSIYLTPRAEPPFSFGALGTKRKGRRKTAPAYIVQFRRRGRFVPVSGRLPRGRALEFGTFNIQRELARQFKLVSAGTTELSDVDFQPPRDIVRSYKVRQGRQIPLVNQFIQRTRATLQSPEEKELIRQARIMAAI